LNIGKPINVISHSHRVKKENYMTTEFLCGCRKSIGYDPNPFLIKSVSILGIEKFLLLIKLIKKKPCVYFIYCHNKSKISH
jgi:hypothetical protein